MHARLRPIGGRSGQGFSLYHDKECESQLSIAHAHGPDRALGLCANPRSKGAKPASKQKVVHGLGFDGWGYAWLEQILGDG